jgi:hypothetical protein
MTRDEAIDVITQSGLFIDSIELLVREAMIVLDIPPNALATPAEPPKLTIVSIDDAKQGNPLDWTWDKTIYGDD